MVTDLTGKTFGRLTVLGQDGRHVTLSKKKYVQWQCECVCKNIVTVLSTSLISGNTKSCGCLKRESIAVIGKGRTDNRRCPKTVAINEYYQTYRASAKKRNYEWRLSLVEFESIVYQNCYYCNTVPHRYDNNAKRYVNEALKNNRIVDPIFAEQKVIYVNGIDRIDNTKGYTFINAATCCTTCNLAKRAMEAGDFEDWILQAADHIRARNNTVQSAPDLLNSSKEDINDKA